MIYLASTSPRRKLLLGRLGIAFETLTIDIPEQWDGSEPAEAYVQRLALEKARAGRALALRKLPVLAADTAVVDGHDILGKPHGYDSAIAMLKKLSGRQHRVLSAVALADDQESCILNCSLVTFKNLSAVEIQAYCASGEPNGKAGGYAIQGRAAAFITRLQGSYSAVMGLPLSETALLVRPLKDQQDQNLHGSKAIKNAP